MLSGIRLVAILEALKEQWFGSPILAYLDSLTVAISSGLKRSQHFRFSSASQPASQPLKLKTGGTTSFAGYLRCIHCLICLMERVFHRCGSLVNRSTANTCCYAVTGRDHASENLIH